MPSDVVCFAVKKGSNVLVNLMSSFDIHCFVGWGGDAIKARAFSIIQLVDGSINFVKSDGGVDVIESRALGDVGKYGGIDRTMVIEDTIKVGTKHRHVFFAIGGKFTICHLHCHLNLLFMMSSRASSKKTDILPCNAWI